MKSQRCWEESNYKRASCQPSIKVDVENSTRLTHQRVLLKSWTEAVNWLIQLLGIRTRLRLQFNFDFLCWISNEASGSTSHVDDCCVNKISRTTERKCICRSQLPAARYLVKKNIETKTLKRWWNVGKITRKKTSGK